MSDDDKFHTYRSWTEDGKTTRTVDGIRQKDGNEPEAVTTQPAAGECADCEEDWSYECFACGVGFCGEHAETHKPETCDGVDTRVKLQRLRAQLAEMDAEANRDVDALLARAKDAEAALATAEKELSDVEASYGDAIVDAAKATKLAVAAADQIAALGRELATVTAERDAARDKAFGEALAAVAAIYMDVVGRPAMEPGESRAARTALHIAAKAVGEARAAQRNTRERARWVAVANDGTDLDHCGGCGGECVVWDEDRPLGPNDPCAWIREPGIWVFDCKKQDPRDELLEADRRGEP